MIVTFRGQLAEGLSFGRHSPVTRRIAARVTADAALDMAARLGTSPEVWHILLM